jgi:hypothetical protein
MFEVVADHDLRLLRITMRGFWNEQIMADYMRVVRRETGELLRTGGCRYILIDMVDFAIQAKEIAEGHANNLKIVRERGGTRVALVMQSALSKLQAARVAADTGHRTFSTEAEAMEWLLSDRDPDAAAR